MNLPDQDQPKSPAKAIRAYCLQCCLESAMEVKLCTAESCPLHPFRFGKNPFTTRPKKTEEQKQIDRERIMRFKPWEHTSREHQNELGDLGGINSHLELENDETALQRGEYPTFGNFPEER